VVNSRGLVASRGDGLDLRHSVRRIRVPSLSGGTKDPRPNIGVRNFSFVDNPIDVIAVLSKTANELTRTGNPWTCGPAWGHKFRATWRTNSSHWRAATNGHSCE
jgi:hypothetical protein